MPRKRPMTELGIQIRADLDRRGWTQRDLADKCGVNYRVINDVMTGYNKNPENIAKIKECLSCREEKDAV